MSFWTTEAILGTLSLAMEFCGFIFLVRSSNESRRKVLLIFVFIALFLFTFLTLSQNITHNSKVNAVSKEIVNIIGNDKKTFEQLMEQVFNADFAMVNEAVDNLVKKGELQHEVIEVYNEDRQLFRVREFHLKRK